MIILIGGASHTGKTFYAQKLLRKYQCPYLSIDHLKMGLIRSGNTKLTPLDDEKLTDYLWPILREMIKTAIENKQNLIVEGCYIPFDWKKDFSEEYRKEIRYVCLIMTEDYIQKHFDAIVQNENVIEQRLAAACVSPEELIRENGQNLAQCIANHCDYILIDQEYKTKLL